MTFESLVDNDNKSLVTIARGKWQVSHRIRNMYQETVIFIKIDKDFILREG